MYFGALQTSGLDHVTRQQKTLLTTGFLKIQDYIDKNNEPQL